MKRQRCAVDSAARVLREPCLTLCVGVCILLLLAMCSTFRQPLTMDPMALWNSPSSVEVSHERFSERRFGRQRLEQFISLPVGPNNTVGKPELLAHLHAQRAAANISVDLGTGEDGSIDSALGGVEVRGAVWTGRYTVQSRGAECPDDNDCSRLVRDIELQQEAQADRAGSGPVKISIRGSLFLMDGVTEAERRQNYTIPVSTSFMAAPPDLAGGGNGSLVVGGTELRIERVPGDADSLRLVYYNASGTSAVEMARRRTSFTLDDLCLQVSISNSPSGCLVFSPLAMWPKNKSSTLLYAAPNQYNETWLRAESESAVAAKLRLWDQWNDVCAGGAETPPNIHNPWAGRSAVLGTGGADESSDEDQGGNDDDDSNDDDRGSADFHGERRGRRASPPADARCAPSVGEGSGVYALQTWYFLDDSDARRALYPRGVWEQVLSRWEDKFQDISEWPLSLFQKNQKNISGIDRHAGELAGDDGVARIRLIPNAEKAYGDQIGAGIVADLGMIGAAMALTLLCAALAAGYSTEVRRVVYSDTHSPSSRNDASSVGSLTDMDTSPTNSPTHSPGRSFVPKLRYLLRTRADLDHSPLIDERSDDEGELLTHECIDVCVSGGWLVAAGGSVLSVLAIAAAFGFYMALSALPVGAGYDAARSDAADHATPDDGAGLSYATGAVEGADGAAHGWLPNSPFSLYALLLLFALCVWHMLLVCAEFNIAASEELSLLLSAAAVDELGSDKGKGAGQTEDLAPDAFRTEAPTVGTPASNNMPPNRSRRGVCTPFTWEIYARVSAVVYSTAIFAMALILRNKACASGWVVATAAAAVTAVAMRADRTPGSLSWFKQWPRSTIALATGGTIGSASASLSCIIIAAMRNERLNGTSTYLGGVSFAIAAMWCFRVLRLARHQQRNIANWSAETKDVRARTEGEGSYSREASRRCLGLDNSSLWNTPPVPDCDVHGGADVTAVRRATVRAEQSLRVSLAITVLSQVVVASSSELPAVQAFSLFLGVGVVVVYATFVVLFPALLQWRWWQLKRAVRLQVQQLLLHRNQFESYDRAVNVAHSLFLNQWRLPLCSCWAGFGNLLQLLSIVLLIGMVIATSGALVATRTSFLAQRFGREDVVPAGASLHEFFRVQEDLFNSSVPLSLVSRGIKYESLDVFSPLANAHRALAESPKVDASQGNDGVIDWFTLPCGTRGTKTPHCTPTPTEPGAGAGDTLFLQAQQPYVSWLVANRTASSADMLAGTYCNFWGELPVIARDAACSLANSYSDAFYANASWLTLPPANQTSVPPDWPRASLLKLWAAGNPNGYSGQAFVAQGALAFVNATAGSSLGQACYPAGEAQIVKYCDEDGGSGEDSLRTGHIVASKASFFSVTLDDPRNMEEQRSIRDAVRTALTVSADALKTLGSRALTGAPDVQGSQIGAAESSDPLYVHSLLFVVLEQFDALRKQALVNLGVGVAAVALSGAAAVETSFASTRNSSPRSRHAAAATATSMCSFARRLWRFSITAVGCGFIAFVASCELLGFMTPLIFDICVSSTSANILLFLPVLLTYFVTAVLSGVVQRLRTGSLLALQRTAVSVLVGGLPLLGVKSPANQQVGILYALAFLLAAVQAVVLLHSPVRAALFRAHRCCSTCTAYRQDLAASALLAKPENCMRVEQRDVDGNF